MTDLSSFTCWRSNPYVRWHNFESLQSIQAKNKQGYLVKIIIKAKLTLNYVFNKLNIYRILSQVKYPSKFYISFGLFHLWSLALHSIHFCCYNKNTQMVVRLALRQWKCVITKNFSFSLKTAELCRIATAFCYIVTYYFLLFESLGKNISRLWNHVPYLIPKKLLLATQVGFEV